MYQSSLLTGQSTIPCTNHPYTQTLEKEIGFVSSATTWTSHSAANATDVRRKLSLWMRWAHLYIILLVLMHCWREWLTANKTHQTGRKLWLPKGIKLGHLIKHQRKKQLSWSYLVSVLWSRSTIHGCLKCWPSRQWTNVSSLTTPFGRASSFASRKMRQKCNKMYTMSCNRVETLRRASKGLSFDLFKCMTKTYSITYELLLTRRFTSLLLFLTTLLTHSVSTH